jgi:hypothetical protein
MNQATPLPPSAPPLEYWASIRVYVEPPVAIGPTGGGTREIFMITGGVICGEGWGGKVLPGGADWAVKRADGSYRVWARYTLQHEDGTLIAIINRGFVWDNGDGTWSGRTSAEFEVADGPHAWMRDAVIIGVLTARDDAPEHVDLAFWRVR